MILLRENGDKMTPRTKYHLRIDINDEELSAYTNRPEVLTFTPAQEHEFLERLHKALFDNNFWDICKAVLMDMGVQS